VVRGVRDGQEGAVLEPVGEEVVEHAAVVAAEDRVLRAALAQAGYVVREDVLQEGLRVGAARLHLAHVGHVEDARATSDLEMLPLDPDRVLDRHLPTGEGDETGPGRSVAIVQRSAAQGVWSSGGQGGLTLPAVDRRIGRPRTLASPLSCP
jgi:hypothetical protein